MASPLTTLIAAKTLWSHMIGRITYVFVFAGLAPAVPSETLYQAGTVTTEVVFEVTSPQDGVALPLFSKIDICWPITVVLDAVRGVAVTVPVVAEPAVNGEPVASESAETA